MKIALSMIAGGDFKQAGAATSNLKKLLKKINLDPVDMRRVIIAAFEAEMNVVIHAYRGDIRVILDSNEIEVEVRDEGPGIPDIDLAMKEGYSTAPETARQLGYGAGLGLPNIRKNTDNFEITSTVGKGTKVCFTVKFKPAEYSGIGRNSLRVEKAYCRECLHCIRACPTKAIRVRRETGPEIFKHLCIDCAECVEACATGALTIASAADAVRVSSDKALVVSPPFLSQFTARVYPQRVMATLNKMGFSNVYILDAWENALREATTKYAKEEAKISPIISPMCPAVVNLVALRFQSLLGNMAPFLSPVEAAQRELANKNVVFLANCPSQLTMLLPRRCANLEIVTPQILRQAVQPLVQEAGFIDEPEGDFQRVSDIESALGSLRVNGIKHVINVLEKVENGRLKDVRILELYACYRGCFGSSLYFEEPFVARYRWACSKIRQNITANAARRETPIAGQTGMRLDADPSKAILKYSEIDELTKSLPGKDCGMCGAPNCATLAEDIVLGRAFKEDCIYLD